MLIDATHMEETRVAIVDASHTLMDYDFNSSLKKTIKGNIYLAKIARVEPSLQAAFVDYGNMRHGFLAFNEIHPDYFRIPMSDREELQKEILTITQTSDHGEDPLEESATDEDDTFNDKGPHLEDSGKRRFASLHRRYKIQEVLKKGQIVLVQAIKEERANKGAALTTFLSLPGRYCVFMPNSPKSGGISRKISNQNDRSRLKKSLSALNLPQGMGLIVRTAGKDRTRTEIKKDAEYLMRLWNDIRETTLASVAPSLIYQEDDIIKRAIRDMYSKDVDEILVEGDEGYKNAKTFMKTLMPSHGKKIKHYKQETCSLFHAHTLEEQIDNLHHAQVSLPSGGSIVLHPTEALVSIDVNSGKSTRERHIEETAFKTNLEAAVEIARQVRLRDLAGLIVIDFIDMDEPRNIAAVERRVKESFKQDRARVQMGRISSFGLFELSRQRLNPSILEVSAQSCSHCKGTGYVRSTESLSMHILRSLEDMCLKHAARTLTVNVSTPVAFYLFNYKRSTLNTIENRHHVQIIIQTDDHLGPENFTIQQENQEKTLEAPLDEIVDDKKQRRTRRRSKKKTEEDSAPQENVSPVNTPPSLPSESSKEEKPLSASARRRRRKKLAMAEAKKQSEETQAPDKVHEDQARKQKKHKAIKIPITPHAFVKETTTTQPMPEKGVSLELAETIKSSEVDFPKNVKPQPVETHDSFNVTMDLSSPSSQDSSDIPSKKTDKTWWRRLLTTPTTETKS